MKNVIWSFTIFICLAIICSCNNPQEPRGKFLSISGLDVNTRPGDNFFQYVNKTWLDSAKIPPTQIGVGSFFSLAIKSREALKEVCEEAVRNHQASLGSVEQRVGDLYASFMDSLSIEEKGIKPLLPVLKKIENIKSNAEIMPFVASEMQNGNSLLYNLSVGADDRNAEVNVAFFNQGGIGLPDRDYYFRNDPQTQKLQLQYQQYLTKLFVLTGDDSLKASASANTVYEIEKRIANGHFTNIELRDPLKNYNKLGRAQLQMLSQFIDWKSTFENMMLIADSVVVGQPKFFTEVGKLLKSVTTDQWRLYLKAGTITNYAFALSKPFVDARYEFYGKVLSGQQQQKPRWERAVVYVDNGIGELVGQLYVKKYFDEKAKKKMMEMIDNIQRSYEKHIRSLDWMSDSTKTRALAKLSTFKRKIGYPDKWKKYDTLKISMDNYFQNLIRINKFNYAEMISKAGKPVDKSEWQLSPPTVNAFYNAGGNEIMFLAGILQPPFFNPLADEAVNYGGIGMVIGHELTHGFDDEGRQYDKDGNLKDWWTKKDAEKFNLKSKAVIDQYNQYVAIDTFHVNGELTLGENIADIGGLAIAFDAFKMTEQGRANKLLDGFTADQRFFLSFGTIWGIKLKDEFMKATVHTDVHSPAEYRVLGPLSNFTPFYEAFDVKESNTMWRPVTDRIVIW